MCVQKATHSPPSRPLGWTGRAAACWWGKPTRGEPAGWPHLTRGPGWHDENFAGGSVEKQMMCYLFIFYCWLFCHSQKVLLKQYLFVTCFCYPTPLKQLTPLLWASMWLRASRKFSSPSYSDWNQDSRNHGPHQQFVWYSRGHTDCINRCFNVFFKKHKDQRLYDKGLCIHQ